jgi:acetyl-CoA carboxylase carboxyltransferase component
MNIRQTPPSETDWRNEVDELEARKANARRMGGPDGVARQHRNGKLTIQQRIERILDANSFAEIGTLAGKGNYDQQGKLVDFTPASTCPSSNGLGQSEVFWNEGSGSFVVGV